MKGNWLRFLCKLYEEATRSEMSTVNQDVKTSLTQIHPRPSYPQPRGLWAWRSCHRGGWSCPCHSSWARRSTWRSWRCHPRGSGWCEGSPLQERASPKARWSGGQTGHLFWRMNVSKKRQREQSQGMATNPPCPTWDWRGPTSRPQRRLCPIPGPEQSAFKLTVQKFVGIIIPKKSSWKPAPWTRRVVVATATSIPPF